MAKTSKIYKEPENHNVLSYLTPQYDERNAGFTFSFGGYVVIAEQR